MSETLHPGRRGEVFDRVAVAYGRHRPTYPDALIDQACEAGGLRPGAQVLEIGCGAGQLTRSLVARGLRVTALEPGPRLIAQARGRVGDAGEVEFVNQRLEEASLPAAHYAAVFAATSIHWIDPDVGWRRLADALVDGGMLALISYFGLDDPRSAEDQQALRAALARVAPGVAAERPAYRDLDAIRAGSAVRSDNVSELWAWLGDYELSRDAAAALFDDARLTVRPTQLEHTSDELNALIGTMSFWAQLSPSERDALCTEHHALHQRIGRPIRSTAAVCLVTARRSSRR